MDRILLFLAPLLCVGFVAGCENTADRDELHVYAAASLTDVMEVLADSFHTAAEGRAVILNVAGSSLLARQIDQGAGADLFVSAHPEWTDFLHERDRVLPPIALPVSNRLVEVRRSGDGAPVESGERLALADPEHVPAGMYAREALECEGRWAGLEDAIVPTLDVRAALAAVQTGAVPAAIVYASDALLTPELDVRPAVSDRCQPQVRYTAAIVSDTQHEEAARGLLALMQSPAARSLWERHGFIYSNERLGH